MADIDVVVQGLGVAGSLLAARLALQGFRVRAYDLSRDYLKPCGEQLTLEETPLRVARSTGAIKTIVRTVDVAVSGKLVTSVTMKPSKWAIIDKPRMIAALREMAKAEGSEVVWGPAAQVPGALTVDARGPYSGPRTFREGLALALRVVARVRSWEGDLALLDFWPALGGLFWVFPYDSEGKVVNAGAGFVGVSNANFVRDQVIKYLRHLLGPHEVLEVKGAPINLFTRPRLSRGTSILVGEAAGLVMAWSGEGNRPAINSAEALAEAIREVGTEDRGALSKTYAALVKKTAREAEMSRLALRLFGTSRISNAFLRLTSDDVWAKYVRQELEPLDLLRALVAL